MENPFIGPDPRPIESELKAGREKISEYPIGLTSEDIRRIELPLESLEYEGEGSSSYSPNYDQQKQEYLETFGIKAEGLGHAETVTSFIIFSHIATLKLIEEAGGDLDKATEIANRILYETRIDRLGYSDYLGKGITYEGSRKRLGFAANTEGRLSEDHYSRILRSILNSQTKKINLRD